MTWAQTPSPLETRCLGVLNNRLTHVYYIALFIHHEPQSLAECPLLLFAGYSLPAPFLGGRTSFTISLLSAVLPLTAWFKATNTRSEAPEDVVP